MIVELAIGAGLLSLLGKPAAAAKPGSSGGSSGSSGGSSGKIDQVPGKRPSDYVEPPDFLPALSTDQVKQILVAAAKKYGVPASWVLTIAKKESGFRHNAADPTSTAAGLGGTLRGTAAGLGFDHKRIKDPQVGAEAIAKLLASLKGWGDARSVFAAYAAGPGALKWYLDHKSATEADKAKWTETQRKNWINGRWGYENVGPTRVASLSEFGAYA